MTLINIVQFPVKVKIEWIDHVEGYSEAKIYKSRKPELRNYFYSSAEIIESVASHTVFVYEKPRINRQESVDRVELPA